MSAFDSSPGANVKDVVSYIGDDQQYSKPKEQFKLVLTMIGEAVGQRAISLIDVGCAAGAFLHHARKQLNLERAVGTEVDELCLAQARKMVPNVEFHFDSLVTPRFIAPREFDVCTCLAVLSYIDDLAPPLETMLSYLRPGGRLYVIDFVNHFPIDVLVRYRNVEQDDEAPWASGLNMRSQVTYERILRRLNPALDISWTKFEMPFALSRSDDPMRAWTIATEESQYQGTVGTGALLFYKMGTVVVPNE